MVYLNNYADLIDVRVFIISVFLIMACGRSEASPSDLELLYTKQIGWTAANVDDPKVVESFRKSFQSLLSNPKKVQELHSVQGKVVLQQGRNLLAAISLKEHLEKCVVSTAAAKGVSEAVAKALNIKALAPSNCLESVSQNKKLQLFNKDLQNGVQENAKNEILEIAQSQLQATKKYWKDIAAKDPIDTAADLMDRQRDLKARTPQEGLELLLYTKALKDRKDKDLISKNDIKTAFSEVQSELKRNEDYLNGLTGKSAADSLQSLIVTNPAAVAEFLLKNPGSSDLVCKVLQGYDIKVSHQQTLDKAFFWGGLIVGGVLLVTGVGAGVGAAVLSGTAAAATLSTVATGVAIAGTVAGGGEALYASSKAYDSFADASNLRSSAFGEGLSGGFSRSDQAKHQAYSDLAEAGFSAVSILPIGTGLKMMKEAAQASRLGSFAKVASEGAAIETESIKSLAVSLKEISADKDVLKILEKSQKNVSSDEMGAFLGYLSDLPPQEREKVLTLIKQKPEKVSEAIRESSAGGVCR